MGAIEIALGIVAAIEMLSGLIDRLKGTNTKAQDWDAIDKRVDDSFTRVRAAIAAKRAEAAVAGGETPDPTSSEPTPGTPP